MHKGTQRRPIVEQHRAVMPCLAGRLPKIFSRVQVAVNEPYGVDLQGRVLLGRGGTDEVIRGNNNRSREAHPGRACRRSIQTTTGAAHQGRNRIGKTFNLDPSRPRDREAQLLTHRNDSREAPSQPSAKGRGGGTGGVSGSAGANSLRRGVWTENTGGKTRTSLRAIEASTFRSGCTP